MAKRILVLGAGRSSSTLIKYLLDHASVEQWEVLIADYDLNLALTKINGSSRAEAVKFDINDHRQTEELISKTDVTISMLPAVFHTKVATACLKFKKHLLTASYVSAELKKLHQEALDSDVLLLNECGLDPGIDHMTAMKAIEHLREMGGKITSFKSFTGGLVAPEFDNNPWNYKFTWNPRNVVLAGRGMCTYIRNGKYKYVPYHRLFSRTERVVFDDLGTFEGYPNRDSLSYRAVYGLADIPTIFRGTLRRPGFCQAWSAFVTLGATEDDIRLEDSENMTYRDFINSFLAYDPVRKVEDKLCDYVGISRDSDVFRKIEWLGVFENKPVGLKNATPAEIMLKLLEDKWKLDEGDKDMIVMQHQFDYQINGESKRMISSLVTYGDDTTHTAMSKTVGLPLGIVVKLLLQGKITARGVVIPNIKEIYLPVVEELSEYGVAISDREFTL